MTAREFFDQVSAAVRDGREAAMLLEYGCGGGGSGGGPVRRSEPSDPVKARFDADEAARARLESARGTVADGLRVVAGLRRVYARKADAVELRYIRLMPWQDVADAMGIGRRTAIAWADQLLDWVDCVGVARAALGSGIAQDSWSEANLQ